MQAMIERTRQCLGGVGRCIWSWAAFEKEANGVMTFLEGKSRRARKRIFALERRMGARNMFISRFLVFTQKLYLGLCRPH